MRFRNLAVAVAALAMISVPAAFAQSEPPFAGLAGNWSGGGFIMLASGGRERLRCRSTYTVGEDGARLRQNLRCASDSYRFDVNGSIVSDRGALTGTWSEINRNVSGNVSGRVSGSQIEARIEGPGFSASMAINTRGDRQSVTIRSPGHEVTEVSLALTKSK
jgi:hypothetical protein